MLKSNDQFTDSLTRYIIEANKGISYELFKDKVPKGQMGIKVLVGEAGELLIGYRKTLFTIQVLAYNFLPLIVIPILAYVAKNWWLLFGIGFSYLFAFLATWDRPGPYSLRWKSHIIYYFFIGVVIFCFRNGFDFFDYPTFFFICAFWSNFFFKRADKSQLSYLLSTMVENKKFFDWTISTNKVVIINKDEEQKKMQKRKDEEESLQYFKMGKKFLELEDYEKSIEYFNKAINVEPFTMAYARRAECKIKIKDYRGTIEDCDFAIEYFPDSFSKLNASDIYKLRGNAKQELSLNEEAELDFIEAKKNLDEYFASRH